MKISNIFTIITQAVARMPVIALGYLLPALLVNQWLSIKRLRGNIVKIL